MGLAHALGTWGCCLDLAHGRILQQVNECL